MNRSNKNARRQAVRSAATTVRTSKQGVLTLLVPLGPSDTGQEYSLGGPPAPSPGTTVYTTHLAITRERR